MSDDDNEIPKPKSRKGVSHNVPADVREAVIRASRLIDKADGTVVLSNEQTERSAKQGTVFVSESGDNLPDRLTPAKPDPQYPTQESTHISDSSNRKSTDFRYLTAEASGVIRTNTGEWIDPELAKTLKEAVRIAMHDGHVSKEEAKQLSELASKAVEPTDGQVRQTRDGNDSHVNLNGTRVTVNTGEYNVASAQDMSENAPPPSEEKVQYHRVSIQARDANGNPHDLTIDKDGNIGGLNQVPIHNPDFAKEAIKAVTGILRDGKLDATEVKSLDDIVSKVVAGKVEDKGHDR